MAGLYEIITDEVHFAIVCFAATHESGEPQAASDVAEARFVPLNDIESFFLAPNTAQAIAQARKLYPFDSTRRFDVNLPLRISFCNSVNVLVCAQCPRWTQAGTVMLKSPIKIIQEEESDLPPQDAKQQALRYILDAWEEAVYDGLDPDCIATAAIFAALSDMIATYGEEPVAVMCERLPERIRNGEFTVNRTKQ